MESLSLSPLVNCIMLVVSMAIIVHLGNSEGTYKAEEYSMANSKQKYLDRSEHERPMMDMGTEMDGSSEAGKKVCFF